MSNSTLLVTTVSQDIMDDYGKDTIPSIIENIQADTLIFHENDVDFRECCNGTTYTSRFRDEDGLLEFVDENRTTLKNRFRHNAAKFAYKVWALKEGVDHAQAMPDKKYMVWLDADVYVKEKVPQDDLIKMISPCDMAWLDRPHFTHGETGFMMFNLQNNWSSHLLNLQHSIYTTRTLFNMKEWHDAYVTTFLVKNLVSQGMMVRNLNTATSGTEAFQHSPLAGKMDHIK